MPLSGKDWCMIILAVIFTIGGIVLVFLSSNITDKLKLEVYRFEIAREPEENEALISQFRFTYDFTKEKGRISFRLVKPSLEYISFYFPFETENNITLSRYNDSEDLISESIENGTDVITIEDIKEQTNIVIDIKEKMLPNAIFDLLHTNNLKINPHKFAFNMTLGKDYECIGECFIDLSNTENFYLTDADSILVKFKGATNSEPQHRFKIMARSVKNANYKNIQFGFGLALIFFGLSYLIDFLLKE